MRGPEVATAHGQEFQAITGIPVEVSHDAARIYFLLKKVPLPPWLPGLRTTDMLFLADLQYPLSAMDMFWTEQEVVRPNGAVYANSDLIEQYLGRSWRRFSWHRNGMWNPSGNPLFDHFAFVEARWDRERVA